MANWAALQEQLTGLPVHKRARYGIHFQKGDQIEAHFVGKPAHYLDGGLWKPIDTALLATADGWFSSPHSDVIIHPDGRVRVKNSDYQQFTELPSAKTGVLSGDRIIRTFPGGEQHLIMKEDGFREEIHVNKQKIPVEKFIARAAGDLPSKYTVQPVTAVDANDERYTFTGDVAGFGAWLEKATYPVVIDPDFSGNEGDGQVSSDNSTYATARSTSVAYDVSANQFTVGQRLATTLYRIYRGFLLFDTSSIGSGATVTQANLKLVAINNTSTDDFDAQIVKQDWSAQSPLSASTREAAYDGCLAGTADDNIWRNTDGLSINTQYTSGNLSTTWISKAGITYYSMRSSRDYGATEPTGNEFIQIASANHATEGYRPVLTVTYSAGGVPKHFMYYQRLRSL